MTEPRITTPSIRPAITYPTLWSHDDTVSKLAHAVNRPLCKAGRLHIDDKIPAEGSHCRRRALGITDRDRHIIIAAGQNARPRKRRLGRRKHGPHMAESVGLAC